MADDAPYTGAGNRAPKITTAIGTVSQMDIADRQLLNETIGEIQYEGDSIDALVLGIESIIEKQRGTMRERKVDDLLTDNELWSGMTMLLTMVRHKAMEIAEMGGEVEKAWQRLSRPVAA